MDEESSNSKRKLYKGHVEILVPHRITGLKVQKRNQQRINVYLDGGYAFGLSRITAAWLRVGQELSEEKITELKVQDLNEVAYQQALRYLKFRPRTETEIRWNLEGHHFTEHVIEDILIRLRESGLVDDTRFARTWIENRNEFRPRSRRALSIELRQRGLDEDIAAEALAEIDDEALAYQAAIRQSSKLKNLEWLDFRRKLTGFLGRRGFNYEVISIVVKRVWDETQSERTVE